MSAVSEVWMRKNMRGVRSRNARETNTFRTTFEPYFYAAYASNEGSDSLDMPPLLANTTTTTVASQQHILALSEQNRSHLDVIKDLTAKNEQLECQVGALRQENIEKSNTLLDRQETISVLKLELAAIKSENEELLKQRNDSTKLADQMTRETVNTKNELARTVQENTELQEDLRNLKSSSDNSRDSINTETLRHAKARDAPLTTQNDWDSVKLPTSTVPTSLAFHREGAHEGGVMSLAIAEDGKVIFSGGEERKIHAWDPEKGKLLYSLTTLGMPLCITCGGGLIIVGCSDGVIRTWDYSKHSPRFELTGHSDKLTSVAYIDSARYAVSVSADRTLKLWDLARRQLHHTVLCTSSCSDVAVANEQIATAQVDGNVKLYESRTGNAAGEVKGVHEMAVCCVRFYNGGSHAVTLGRDDTIAVIDIARRAVISRIKNESLSVGSNSQRFAVSPDGHYIASGTKLNGLVLIFDNTDDDGAPKTLSSSSRDGYVPLVCWNPNGGSGVAALGVDKRLLFWR